MTCWRPLFAYTAKTLSEITALIYDAAIDDNALAELPDALRQYCNGDGCVLASREKFYGEIQTIGVAGFEGEVVRAYLHDLRFQDPWTPVLADLPRNVVHQMEPLVSPERVKSSEFYRKLKSLGAEVCFSLPVSIELVDQLGIVALQRKEVSGPFEAEQRCLLQDLVPHLQKMMITRNRLESARKDGSASRRSFQSSGHRGYFGWSRLTYSLCQ